jgi:hypothetical protein
VMTIACAQTPQTIVEVAEDTEEIELFQGLIKEIGGLVWRRDEVGGTGEEANVLKFFAPTRRVLLIWRCRMAMPLPRPRKLRKHRLSQK